MADERVLIAIQAVNQAKSALDKAGRDLDGYGEKVKGAGKGAKGASDSLGGLQTAIKGAVTIAAIQQAARFTKELFDMGAESIDARKALDSFAGADAPEFLSEMNRALQGTVSETEAAQIATRILSFGFAETATEAAEMSRVAAILGQQFRGLGAAEAGIELTTMITNESLLRLDSFGISSAAVKANIEELKETMPGLSSQQRFLNATMAEAIPLADQLAESLEAPSGDAARLAANLENLQSTIAVGATPALANMVGGLNVFIDTMEEAANVSEVATASFFSSQLSVEELAVEYDALTMTQKRWLLTQRTAQIANEEGIRTFKARRLAEKEAREATVEFIEALKSEIDAESEAITQRQRDVASLSALVTVTDMSTEALSDNEDAIEDTADAESGLERAAKARADAQRDATQAIAEALDTQETFTNLARETTDVLNNLGVQGFQAGGASAEVFADALAAAGNDFLLLGESGREWQIQAGLISEEEARLSDGLMLISEAAAQLGLEQASSLFEDFTSGGIASVEELADTIDGLTSRVGDGFDNIRSAAEGGFFPAEDLEAIGEVDFSSAEDGLTTIGQATTGISDDLTLIAEAAPGTFEAIGTAAELANEQLSFAGVNTTQIKNDHLWFAENVPAIWELMGEAAQIATGSDGSGLGLAASLIEGIRSAWLFLLENPVVSLKVFLSAAGDITGASTPDGGGGGPPGSGGSAGGSNFMAMGRMTLEVGEDGPEHVQVTPTKPGGRTWFSPNAPVVHMAGGGSLMAGLGNGGSGGGMQVSIPITVNVAGDGNANDIRSAILSTVPLIKDRIEVLLRTEGRGFSEIAGVT